MAQTTTRLTGHKGTAYVGSTSGASDVYAGADITEWDTEMAVDLEDLSALSDAWKVNSYTVKSAKGSFKKFVVTAAMAARLASDPVVYLELYLGVAQGSTAATGSKVLSGMAILSGVGLSNPRGGVVENVSFEFSGTVTVS